jgi:hypothetical protein
MKSRVVKRSLDAMQIIGGLIVIAFIGAVIAIGYNKIIGSVDKTQNELQIKGKVCVVTTDSGSAAVKDIYNKWAKAFLDYLRGNPNLQVEETVLSGDSAEMLKQKNCKNVVVVGSTPIVYSQKDASQLNNDGVFVLQVATNDQYVSSFMNLKDTIQGAKTISPEGFNNFNNGKEIFESFVPKIAQPSGLNKFNETVAFDQITTDCYLSDSNGNCIGQKVGPSYYVLIVTNSTDPKYTTSLAKAVERLINKYYSQ